MKKVLLAGKINAISQELYDYLGNSYSVQVCEPITSAVERMNKIIRPDVILVFMKKDVAENVLHFVSFDIQNTPVLVICESNDEYENRYCSSNMNYMYRPIDNARLGQKLEELTSGSVELSGDKTSSGSISMADTTTLDEAEKMGTTNTVEDATFAGLFKPKAAEKKKILAIDDDAMILRTIKGMLQDEYEVILATNVDKGLGLAMLHDFDAILLDYEMPNIDGCTAFAMFKMNFKTQDTPVIFLTGVSDRERITEVIKLKPAAYLLKPVETDKVKQVLREVLG